jgi:hypothetical protein
MRYALCDHPGGPKNPHNRLCKAKEENVKSACELGKIESAFRDDKRDFYGLRKDWSIEDLQEDLSLITSITGIISVGTGH